MRKENGGKKLQNCKELDLIFYILLKGGGGRAERQWLKENVNQKMLR